MSTSQLRTIAGAVLGTVCLAFPGGSACSLLAAEQAAPAIAAGGGARTAADLIPPAVDAAQNAAPVYLEVIRTLEGKKVWNVTLAGFADEVYTKILSQDAQRNPIELIDTLTGPGGEGAQTVGEVLKELGRQLDGETGVAALGLLSKAAAMPACRFDLDYSKGAGILLPHLAKMRSLGRFLGCAALYAAEQGNAPAAWQRVELQFRLADALSTEPLLISQLVRIALTSIAVDSLQQVAQACPVSAETVRRLDPLLVRLADPAGLRRAIDGERLLLGGWIFNLPPAEMKKTLAECGCGALSPEVVAAERAYYTQHMLRMSEMAAQPYCKIQSDLQGLAAEIQSDTGHPLTKSLVRSLSPCYAKFATQLAKVNVTRTGLRLELARLAGGNYPDDLGSLAVTDKALAPVNPEDPFTGQPLFYRREGAGFVLYSIGQDGVDNGGIPSQTGAPADGDVVWRVER